MADITVYYHDEVFVQIVCVDGIRQELSDHFTFKAPNSDFHPLVKARKWDGLIRLFNLKTNLLYGGLIKPLYEFALERKYTIEFADHCLIHTTNFSLEECKEFIIHLNSPVKPRDYQIKGITKAIRYRRMVMLSPTSSGKSFISYCIMRYILNKGLDWGKKILIIVPTVNLVEQLYGDFESYGMHGWSVENYVHKIYSGQDKNTDKQVVISTWQSIFDIQDPMWYQQFVAVIGDECHTFAAKSLTHLMKQLTNAKYRIGMTGTLDDIKVHELLLQGLFGPVCRLITTKQLMDNKHIAKLEIKCITLKHPQSVCSMLDGHSKIVDGKESHRAEIDYLIKHKQRNRFIENLAFSLEKNTLILFQFVDLHGKEIFDEMINKHSDRKMFLVYGGTEIEDREKIRQIAEKKTSVIIVASYGVFATGVNIKNLHNVIFASPSKSKIRVLQAIGRALRLNPNKEKATIFDISDDLRYNGRINHTLQHFGERLKIYHKEGFKVTQYLVELDEINNKAEETISEGQTEE